jgi:hypothetical protein
MLSRWRRTSPATRASTCSCISSTRSRSRLVVYGDRARDGTPQRLRKSIPFVPFGPTTIPIACSTAFLKERSAKRAMPRQGGDHGALVLAGSKRPSLIALGASTGGVSALETVLTAFPVDCPPTLVVQHIRAGFIDSMIKRLDGHCIPAYRACGGCDCDRSLATSMSPTTQTDIWSFSPVKRHDAGLPRHRPATDIAHLSMRYSKQSRADATSRPPC